MTEGAFLYELARVESAVIPDEVLLDRIEFERGVSVSHRAAPGIELGLDWSRFEIADAFRRHWSADIDDSILRHEEVAPVGRSVTVRWRELHRGLVLASRLQQFDSDARLTRVELVRDTESARVSARFNGIDVTVMVRLGDATDHSWDAIEMLVEAGLETTSIDRCDDEPPAEHDP